MVAGGRF